MLLQATGESCTSILEGGAKFPHPKASKESLTMNAASADQRSRCCALTQICICADTTTMSDSDLFS